MTRLSGGSQNELFVVERDGIAAVLRIPPATAGEARFDGLRRESRLLRVLKGADVPHAEFVAGADDPGVLGAPFYLMQPVDGWSPMGLGQWPEPFESDLEQRRGLAFELVRGAALLSRVDWEERGLTGFGRPENFHERQVSRWLARRAIQIHGALGTTYDLPLTRMLASGVMLALADGPTEVHQTTVAKQVLRGYQPADGLWPSEYLPARRAAAAAELLDQGK